MFLSWVVYNIFMKKRFSFYGPLSFFSLILFLFSISVNAAVTPCPFTWTKNLKVGSVSEEVLKLQQFLNSESDTTIAVSGAGSVGNESPVYGPRTAKAIAKFQEKYSAETLAPVGLTKGSGFVGTLTRAKLNSLCMVAAGPVSVAPTVMDSQSNVGDSTAVSSVMADTLTVSVPEQPAHTLAPASAGWVPFTSITLTAGGTDVVVKSITVERTGFGADGAFDSVVLADQDSNQIGLSRSLRSNHKVDLGDSFTIPAQTSKTLTVMANMVSDLSGFDGQMPAFQIDAIDTSAKISGTLPVRGTNQTVNSSLVIGTAHASLSQFDPGTATNRYINDNGIRFSGVRFSADSKEDLEFSAITWDQTGSASNDDFANIKTVVNGVSYPTTVDGKTFTSVLEPPILITKGNSIDVYVTGDLKATGANRTVEFDIKKSEVVALLGKTYGFYVLVLPDSATATSGHSVFITSDGTTDGDEGVPFFSGSIVTINAGTFTTIGK